MSDEKSSRECCYDLVHFGPCLKTFECCTSREYDPATGYFPFYLHDGDTGCYDGGDGKIITLDDACVLAKRHKFEPTRLGCRLVSRTFFAALGANALRIFTRQYLRTNPDIAEVVIVSPNIFEYKGLVIGHKIESSHQ